MASGAGKHRTESVCPLLAATASRLESQIQRSSQRNGLGRLTTIEWLVLRALYEEQGRKATDLAAEVSRAPTSFTPILRNLQKKGWIIIFGSVDDRRAVSVELTVRAQTMRTRFIEFTRSVENSITTQLGGKKKYDALMTLLQNLLLIDLSDV